MATGALIAGGVAKGVGSRKEKKASKSAAKSQEALDAENRRLYQLEVDESVRRTEDVNEQTESLAMTQIGASGFSVGSSMDAYLETIQATHAGDVDWMRTSGASNVAIQEREASARKRNSDAQANASFIKGVGGAISSTAGAWG